jgi:hypothetical protein
MSKITLREFESVSDLFLAYYAAKAQAKEDGWIERHFKKYPALRSIWKVFDQRVKDMEKKTDAIAKPYLQSQDTDIK